jgi:hypothetical protein
MTPPGTHVWRWHLPDHVGLAQRSIDANNRPHDTHTLPRDTKSPSGALRSAPADSAVVSVIAIRGATSEGTLSCSAKVDGKQVAQKTIEGTFITAACIKLAF